MTISIILVLIVRVVSERQNEMWKDSTEADDDNGHQVITIAHKRLLANGAIKYM